MEDPKKRTVKELIQVMHEMSYERMPLVQNLTKALEKAEFHQAPVNVLDSGVPALRRARDTAVAGLYKALNHIGKGDDPTWWKDYRELKRIVRNTLIELGEIKSETNDQSQIGSK